MKNLMMTAALALMTISAAPAVAEDETAAFIEQFQGYLDISEKFLGFVNRPDASVFFAVEGIVEIHEERGEQAAAIPILLEVLDLYPDNQAVRNVVRFKLRDLYRETGQTELALAELRTLIEENR